MDMAVLRIRSQLRQAHEPVLFARVKLTMAADAAVARPAVAQANIDLNGRPIRAQAAGGTMRDAIDLMTGKLKFQLQRAERNWAGIRGTQPTSEPGEWRHQSVPTERLPYFPRPAEERSVVRHKSYGLPRLTPDEAIADLELLDYDFHLFTERSTGEDSVVYRTDDGYRIAQAHLTSSPMGPAAAAITVSPVPAPTLDIGAAEARLEALGQPFIFFVDAQTGRGNIVYHRYDGDYGLITPADA
jgi:hypothetical protein